MSLCEEPARKVFIKCCRDLIEDNTSDNSSHRKWILDYKDKSVSLRLIWIQGIIINVLESRDVIAVDDGSGVAFISIKDVPGTGSWIKKGQYVMVIGDIFFVTSDVKIKALKITHLVEPNAEILWILEVMDYWNYLNDKILHNLDTF